MKTTVALTEHRGYETMVYILPLRNENLRDYEDSSVGVAVYILPLRNENQSMNFGCYQILLQFISYL